MASVLDVHPAAIRSGMFDINVDEDEDGIVVTIKKHVMSGVEEVINSYGDPINTFTPDVISKFQEAFTHYRLPENITIDGATDNTTSWTIAFEFGHEIDYTTIDKDTNAIIDSGIIVDRKPVSFEIQD